MSELEVDLEPVEVEEGLKISVSTPLWAAGGPPRA